ncbi:MAG: hypothetical protein LBP59_15670 [Planctomycetaceae bacterium]|jgi:flagellar biosynthesis GTPase FlhF|nr:hypothetical protein [Planctomycetaceae bacterium]
MNSLKTFRGDSFQECLLDVYAEFGEGAKILHSREVTESRWFGLRKIRYVEITAAKPEIETVTESKLTQINNQNLDHNKNQIKPPPNATQNLTSNATQNFTPNATQNLTPNATQNFTQNATQDNSDGGSKSVKREVRGVLDQAGFVSSFFEVGNRRKDLVNFGGEVGGIGGGGIDGGNVGVEVSVGVNDGKLLRSSEELVDGWRRLCLDDMNPTLLQRNLFMMFEEIVCFGGAIELGGGCRVVALAGATGVGKTSTAVKLAAYYKLRLGYKVGLLTTDVFRIAAAEQLQRYADMLEIQFETASGADKVQTALRKLIDCDLVLVDTPGTNPLNEVKLRSINAVLRAANANEVHLLLPATSSLPVFLDTMNRFAILQPTGLTLTKLDEAVGISDVYKMLKSNRLPLKFFTLGQNIAEDIELAGAARLVSLYQQQSNKI